MKTLLAALLLSAAPPNALQARVTGGVWSIPTGVGYAIPTQVPLSAVDYDAEGQFDPTSGSWTVARDGLQTIDAQVEVSGCSPSDEASLQLRRQSPDGHWETVEQQGPFAACPQGLAVLNLNTTLRLERGEQLALFVFAWTAAPETWLGGSSAVGGLPVQDFVQVTGR